MRPDRFAQVRALLLRTVDLPPEERGAYLDEACRGDPELRREVESMLAHHDDPPGMLRTGGWASRVIDDSAERTVPARRAVDRGGSSPAPGEDSRSAPASASGGPQPVDASLGPYEIIKPLGAGGMGAVYLAHETRLRRKVAVKLVGDRMQADEAAHDMLIAEARTAASLNHPHICTIYEVGEANGQTFIGMEYVEGQPLSEQITAGGLPFETVIRVGAQIAEALAHAHRHGIVHRDLKSANVMTNREGRVKVLDFGIARQLRDQEIEETKTAHAAMSEQSGIAGTLPYMAPELLQGGRADRRSDIWALGIILYEMTMGRRPFTGELAFQLCASIVSEPLAELPDEVPAGLRTVIRKCLEKNPDRRYQEAGQVHAALEALQLVAAPPSTREKSSWTRWMARATAALAVVGIGLAAWYWIPRSPGDHEPPPPPPSPDLIAVLPFRVRGDDAHAHLGAGMMDLLGVMLAAGGELRTVPSDAVSRTTAGNGDPARVAERLGAGLYVTGSVIEVGGRFQATASLHASDGAVLHSARAGVADEAHVFGLAEDLAQELLAGLGFRGLDTNLDAMLAQVAGDRLWQAGEYRGAVEQYQQGVVADSLFGRGWLRLSMAAWEAGDRDLTGLAASRAVDLSNRLSKHDRLFAAAMQAFARSDFDEAQSCLESITGQFPDDADAWWSRGTLRLRTGALRGLRLGEAYRLFERAEEVRPLRMSSQHFEVAWAAAADGRLGEAVARLDTAALLAVNEGEAHRYRVIVALARGDSRDQALLGLRSASDGFVLTAALDVARFVDDLPTLERTIQPLIKPTRPAGTRALGHIQLAHLELARGRWRAAKAELAAAGELDPVYASEYRALLFAVPFLEVSPEDLESERAALAGSVVAGRGADVAEKRAWLDPHADLHAHLRVYLLGLLSARLGDTGAAEEHASELEGMGGSGEAAALSRALPWSIRAELDRTAGLPGEAVADLEQARCPEVWWARSRASAFLAGTRDRYVRGHLLAALGNDEDALRWFDAVRQGQTTYDVAFIAPSHMESARIHERRGDREAAASHYRRFVQLWQNCDPELQPVVDAARARLASMD